MGRPREFDETEVLRRATALFGAQGFDAVSVDMVVKALGMNRASFYKLHGSKHGLARAALEQVCERARHGDVPGECKDFVVVALAELSRSSDEMRALAARAVELCFGNDPALLGQHLLDRANRPTT